MPFNRDLALDSFFLYGTSFHLVGGAVTEYVPYIEMCETEDKNKVYTLVCETVHGDSPLAAPTPKEVWHDIRTSIDDLCRKHNLPHLTIGQVNAIGEPRPGGAETVIDLPPKEINN